MKKRGHITIFLSMTLVLVCAVLFTTIEAARTAASAVYFQMSVDSAVESCFGEYYRPLWEQYRLLALYEDESVEARIEKYLDCYQNSEGVSFLRFDEGAVTVKKITYLTDQSTYFLQENGADYMKYHLAAGAVEDLMEQFDLLNQIRSAAGFVKKIAAFAETILEAEEQVREIRDLAEAVVTALEEGQHIAGALLEQMTALQGQEGLPEEERRAQLLQVALNAAKEMQEPMAVLEEAWPDLVDAVEEFEQTAAGLAGKLAGAVEEFEAGGYTGVVRTLLEEQLGQVQAYSSEGGQRYEAVRLLWERLASGRDQLKNLIDLVERLSAEGTSLADVLEALKEWCDQALSLAGLDVPDWMAGLGELQEDIEEAPEISLKVWTEEALLELLLGEGVEVSDANLPEEGLVSEKTPTGGTVEAAWSEQLATGLLFREYLAKNMTSFQEGDQDHFMKYELEYLLSGHESDRENLLAAIGDLLLVREGVNFLEYLSDSAKCQQAALTAAALVGATGNPLLVQLLQTGILAVWALEDAVADVQQLMRGEQVPLLSLFGQEWVMLDYRGYLRVLLAFQDVETLRLRCLDLIQATMQKEDEGFDITRCVYGMEAEVQAKSGTLFSRLPFVQAMEGVQVTEGSYRVVRTFSYDS